MIRVDNMTDFPIGLAELYSAILQLIYTQWIQL
jgi:hypothetical protein